MRLAGRDQIKDEMTSRIQIFPDAPERGLQSDLFKYVIERIEVGGDQIDWRGQTQTTNVLLQQTNILTGAVTCRHGEHVRGTVHRKNRNAPALIQVGSEKSCPATDISGAGKSNIVAPDEALKRGPGACETPKANGDVIGLGASRLYGRAT